MHGPPQRPDPGRRLLSARRALAGATFVALAVLGPALPAGADPAGPTDYRTVLVGLEPATDAVDVSFVGGDSFLHLTVEPGHTVEVTGYQGEAFVRVAADGTVTEDRASPTWALSQDRYGAVDADAIGGPPDWQVVATDGSHAWHDHRAHWMSPQRPPGASAGDQVLEAVVPMTVDGRDVDATVASYLEQPPGATSWTVVTGAAVAAAVLVALAARRARVALVGGVVGLVALASGVVAVRSVPAETGPSPSLWVPPLLAVVSVAVAVALGRGSPGTGRRLAGLALAGLAGLELALWGWFRREALVRAILATDVPPLLDRALVAVAVVVGLGVLVTSVRALFDAATVPTEA